MMKLKLNVIVVFLIAAVACTAQDRQVSENPPSHVIWDKLTKQHVGADGIVNYKGFIKDKALLEQYLNAVSSHAPDENKWSKEEQLAYWINAYNAFTVKLIVDNYPIESIQDLHPTLKVPGVNTVWHKKFFKIGGRESSLDEIEHSILRKKFNEPRIHFAINCASFSCPPLLNEAYMADKLEQQLEASAKRFINDTGRNKIGPNRVEISKIFSWFTKDFTREGSVIDFLNRYATVKIKNNAKVNYLDYDWALNDH